MRLNVTLDRPGWADGTYAVSAGGCIAASLHWADERGPLPDWTAFAYVPLDQSGEGCFRFTGGRAIPDGATHAAAQPISPGSEQLPPLMTPLPQAARSAETPEATFAVMSDLHLSANPGRILRAMRLAAEADCVLMAGDLTNDGLPDQFERLWQCIGEELDGVAVLAVTGNHDYPHRPLPLVDTGIDSFPRLQERLLARAAQLGVDCHEHESGAFRAHVRGVDVFGLNAVTHFRRFAFAGDQLDWLERGLETATRSIVLCHAPLRLHNPMHPAGDVGPYLSQDARIQSIVDAAGSVCFAAGHTHVSYNDLLGCVEADADRGNIYLNDASVTKSMLRRSEPFADRMWLDGAVAMLSVYGDRIEIAARAVSTQRWIARGHYRLQWAGKE